MQKNILLILILLFLAGCSSFSAEDIVPDRRPDYRGSRIINPLEVPPDLTASTLDDTLLVPELNPTESANLSDYAAERGADGVILASQTNESVLSDIPDMRVVRDGSRRWLVVDQSANVLWPRIKEFWTGNGLALDREDPRVGIMETKWLENRSDVVDGPIRAVLARFLDFAYSAPTRDKFRVRLEPVADATEVYLTHYGVEEIYTQGGTRGSQRDATTTLWQPRPADPELEAEMLNRLMIYLGASEKRAQAEIANETVKQDAPRVDFTTSPDGQRVLVIEQTYDRAWRLVGLALDSGDFAVEDQNRSQGLYAVEFRDNLAESKRNQGLFSKLAFWRDDEKPERLPGDRYQVRLAGRGEYTLVVIQDGQGQPSNNATARRILDELRESISQS